MQLILASQSPRRREILDRAGFAFTVAPPSVAEELRNGEGPREYVVRLAREKAAAIPAGHGDVVLAADTVVVVDAHILEKPASDAEAERMLRLLSGREHSVLTGICLRHGPREVHALEETSVTFAPLSRDEIRAYVASGEPFDKAGGYAIQGLASKYVTEVRGCYFNVVGLPIGLVYRTLKEVVGPERAAQMSTPS